MSSKVRVVGFCPEKPCGIRPLGPGLRTDGSRIQAIRAALLAAVDAVTTEVALLTAISVAGMTDKDVVTAGVAAAVAGAIGMAAGEYGSVLGASEAILDRRHLRREAWSAAGGSFLSFLLGASGPLVAFIYAPSGWKIGAVVVAGGCVALVAGFVSGASGRRRKAALRQLLVTALAVMVAVVATSFGG